MIVRRDVIFNEFNFNQAGDGEAVKSMDTVELIPDSEKAHGPEDYLAVSSKDNLRCSERQRQPPIRYGVDEFADVAKENEVCHSSYNVCQISEPQTIEEALKGNYAKEWKAAANSEYNIIHS